LPARVCWLGSSESAKFGLALNDLVARGELKAPVVIARDHIGGGSAASPFAETEAMRDDSGAVADWPFLNAMLSIASGGSWVSINIGGGSGIADYVHAGFAVVADGTHEMSARIERALTYDPAVGIARHSDAGYLEALDIARRSAIKIPMK
jgi:urocanate hydratase